MDLRRREFLALAGLAASAVTLGGCGRAGGGSAPDGSLRAAFGQPVTDLTRTTRGRRWTRRR
ncbi:hypothetical protein ACFHW2_27780 [Actinomadura sp. LOL_016]|uniref:hypothetical protein n=1 Tax=unclassified Actinomadura TaxID=2626254 RepID=UPI003A7F7257